MFSHNTHAVTTPTKTSKSNQFITCIMRKLWIRYIGVRKEYLFGKSKNVCFATSNIQLCFRSMPVTTWDLLCHIPCFSKPEEFKSALPFTHNNQMYMTKHYMLKFVPHWKIIEEEMGLQFYGFNLLVLVRPKCIMVQFVHKYIPRPVSCCHCLILNLTLNFNKFHRTFDNKDTILYKQQCFQISRPSLYTSNIVSNFTSYWKLWRVTQENKSNN